jgi:hypothetical protein
MQRHVERASDLRECRIDNVLHSFCSHEDVNPGCRCSCTSCRPVDSDGMSHLLSQNLSGTEAGSLRQAVEWAMRKAGWHGGRAHHILTVEWKTFRASASQRSLAAFLDHMQALHAGNPGRERHWGDKEKEATRARDRLNECLGLCVQHNRERDVEGKQVREEALWICNERSSGQGNRGSRDLSGPSGALKRP